MARSRFRRNLSRVWVAAGLCFVAWMWFGMQAAGLPEGVLRSDAAVRVSLQSAVRSFDPVPARAGAGLIFLPGGLVEPVAYAPLLKAIAAAGYPTRLVELPWRCACTAGQEASLFGEIDAVIAGDAETRWVLGGHSRGAMLAARYALGRAQRLAGLALLATTHPKRVDLSGFASLPVWKIHGAADGIAPLASARANSHNLPENTRWIEIEGGNHAQFGYYRYQLGDGSAAISRAEQQRQIEQALLAILAEVEGQRATLGRPAKD